MRATVGRLAYTAMPGLLAKVLAAFAAAYAALAIFVWWRQERIAFPAPRSPLPDPTALGVRGGERITLTTTDGVTLHGWYLPPADGAPVPAPGLLWFGGNAETIAGIWPVVVTWRPPEFGLLVLDYRGYGTSGGRPTEAGLYRDGEAAWDGLAARSAIDPHRIAVFGRSLGSAVALHVALTRDVRAVVLESPLSSAADLRRTHYPFLPGALLRLTLDNVGRARALAVPLLVFHGADDRIAPAAMGRLVAEAGRAHAFHLIPHAGHNDTFAVGGDWYRDTMATFLREAVQ